MVPLLVLQCYKPVTEGRGWKVRYGFEDGYTGGQGPLLCLNLLPILSFRPTRVWCGSTRRGKFREVKVQRYR